MSPEGRNQLPTAESEPHGDEWNGPWGIIEPVPQSVETLCVHVEDEPGRPRVYYFPYRTIGKWNWRMEAPEVLEIQIAGMQIVISGTGLRRLADALKTGQLGLLQKVPRSDSGGEIRIAAISVDDA